MEPAPSTMVKEVLKIALSSLGNGRWYTMFFVKCAAPFIRGIAGLE